MERKYTIEAVERPIHCFLGPVLTHARLKLQYEISEGQIDPSGFETPDVVVRFFGPDVDLLLENRAELLLALEQLTMDVLRMPQEEHSKLCFDANDYRMLRIEELRLSATAAADRVKRTGAPFFFSPMNSRERRIIHLALNDDKAVRSESAGMGPNRQVVVYPAGMPSTAVPPPYHPGEGRPGGGRPGGGRPGGRGGRPSGGGGGGRRRR